MNDPVVGFGTLSVSIKTGFSIPIFSIPEIYMFKASSAGKWNVLSPSPNSGILRILS